MEDAGQRGSLLLRGILDACLLALVGERDRYGYELATALREAGLPIVKDGTIYPLLARLERRGQLESYPVPAAGGPPRRYYRLTEAGADELVSARSVWRDVSGGVDAVLAQGGSRATTTIG